ncbi:hypothetical protein M409DRAFT_61299 [Zasmidium cellare ATCC 36951]|uniref:Ubiquitin-like domain-containing protein n=1 Tax=Zasmidium cellare ATCC 36951 TaxID=1080233 RepID=A0A6A6BZB7_ZASCE|nr:uncharacterized protein M409DRAFT_61299 [Zasmidium cellare ATCC 36951]KAF2158879.1 hypothetical protein M409DRAFT_61299 [Zasmidium cellare ATCC 36951]
MSRNPTVGYADFKKNRLVKGPVVGRRYMCMSAYGDIEKSNAEYNRSRNPFAAEEQQPAQPTKKTTNKKKEVRTRGRKKKAASPKRKKRADSFLNAHPLDQAERNIAKMGNKKGEDDNEDEAPAHRRETRGHLAAEMEEVKQAEAASLACQPVTKVDDTVWPPYGTDEFPPTEPTYCLGLARLPAEIADDFKAELAKDLQKFYQRLQFSSEPVQEFGQELEDVGVEFISKDVAVAKQVKDAINGVEVLGKKVQPVPYIYAVMIENQWPLTSDVSCVKAYSDIHLPWRWHTHNEPCSNSLTNKQADLIAPHLSSRQTSHPSAMQALQEPDSGPPERPGWEPLFPFRPVERAEREISGDPTVLLNSDSNVSVQLSGRREIEDASEKEDDSFDIHVRMLAQMVRRGPPAITFRVRPSTTLWQIKKMIEEREGLRATMLTLRYNGRYLGGEDTHHKPLSAVTYPQPTPHASTLTYPQFSFPKDTGAIEARTCFPPIVRPTDRILVIFHSEALQGDTVDVEDDQWTGGYADALERRLLSGRGRSETIEVVFHPAKQFVWRWIAEMRTIDFKGPSRH